VDVNSVIVEPDEAVAAVDHVGRDRGETL